MRAAFRPLMERSAGCSVRESEKSSVFCVVVYCLKMSHVFLEEQSEKTGEERKKRQTSVPWCVLLAEAMNRSVKPVCCKRVEVRDHLNQKSVPIQ